MIIRQRGRGLIYLRRSGDKQETSLEKQLTWALDIARDQQVFVDATLADLLHMQAKRLHAYKSIRLDNAITGADLERPGLKALVDDAMDDPSISHVLAFKRDRLGRPDSPVEMMAIEGGLRHNGVTFVFSDGISTPSALDDGSELAGWIMMLFDYYRSGKFLRELAEQMILTQRQLAQKGFWTGGNAPYGFSRALVDERGVVLELLPRGKRVRQAGCHVVILPDDSAKLETWDYILRLKEQGWGYKRIVRHLNELNIPSPDAGRIRTDHGMQHEVSGHWSHTTVRDLCMSRAILGLLDYGRRSEGKHRRLCKDGARQLQDSDRNGQKKPKVIMNNPSLIITSRLPAEPKFDPERWEKIQAETQKRSRVQRGIPRTRDPARYPLSCRLVDLTDGCGSVMYGNRHSGRLVYTCGAYMKTAGDQCENNSVDAEATLAFTLDTLWELTDRLGSRDELRRKLMERAAGEQPVDPLQLQREQQRAKLQVDVAKLERDFAAARRNYATEENPALRALVAEEVANLQQELLATKEKLAAIPEVMASAAGSPEEEVDRALALLDDIRRIARDRDARLQVLPLVQRLGMKLGMRFIDAKNKVRRVRRLVGGIISFGDEPFPCGRTNGDSRRPQDGTHHQVAGFESSRPGLVTSAKAAGSKGKDSSGEVSSLEGCCVETGPQEGVSFTKVSRGDWI